jgi:hypothetical protein
MKLEEIINQIDEDFYKENSYHLSITDPEEFATQVAIKFGEQCFEAGREPEYGWAGKMEGNPQYENYEDYLNELYDKEV